MSDELLHDLRVRVAELERRLTAIDGGGTPAPADTEIVELVRGGNKIEAIKRYREQTGVGLAEARDAVERIDASL